MLRVEAAMIKLDVGTLGLVSRFLFCLCVSPLPVPLSNGKTQPCFYQSLFLGINVLALPHSLVALSHDATVPACSHHWRSPVQDFVPLVCPNPSFPVTTSCLPGLPPVVCRPLRGTMFRLFSSLPYCSWDLIFLPSVLTRCSPNRLHSTEKLGP